MKNISIFVLLIAMSVLPRCSKDEGNDISGSLIGKWQGESVEASIEVFNTVIWEESDDTFDAEIEFHENGTVTATNDGEETEGTWEKDGSTLTTNADLGLEDFNGFQELKIKKLTETDLELFIKKDTTYMDVTSGSEITGTLRGTAHFKRLPD